MMYATFFLLMFAPIIIPNLLTIKDNKSIQGEIKYRNLYYVLMFGFMVLLLTLRHDYVGTDTQNYRLTYDLFNHLPFEKALLYNNDVGFVAFYKLFLSLGLDFRTVLFFQAIFYIGSATFIIKKHSKSPIMSYWIFMTFGFFIFATTMRQAIAISFVLISFDFIINRKLIPYLLCIIAASTFHLSVLIFLPMYWVHKLRLTVKTLVGILLALSITTLFRNSIGSFVLSYNNNEYATTQTGGFFLLFFIIALLVLGVIYHDQFLRNDVNKLLFFMIATTLLIFPVAKLNPALVRLTSYNYIFIILYVSNLASCIRDRGMRGIITFGLIFLGIYYFYFKLNSYGIRMHPYIFFWENYPLITF